MSPSPCHVLMLSVCMQVVVVGHHRCCHMFGSSSQRAQNIPLTRSSLSFFFVVALLFFLVVAPFIFLVVAPFLFLVVAPFLFLIVAKEKHEFKN